MRIPDGDTKLDAFDMFSIWLRVGGQETERATEVCEVECVGRVIEEAGFVVDDSACSRKA